MLSSHGAAVAGEFNFAVIEQLNRRAGMDHCTVEGRKKGCPFLRQNCKLRCPLKIIVQFWREDGWVSWSFYIWREKAGPFNITVQLKGEAMSLEDHSTVEGSRAGFVQSVLSLQDHCTVEGRRGCFFRITLQLRKGGSLYSSREEGEGRRVAP